MKAIRYKSASSFPFWIVVLLNVSLAASADTTEPLQLKPLQDPPSVPVWARRGIGRPTALWIDAQGRTGWAVGSDGTVVRITDGQWTPDAAASKAAEGNDLWALWLDPSGRTGWAVGAYGSRMQLIQDPVGTVVVKGLTRSLKGSAMLKFETAPLRSPSLSFLNERQTPVLTLHPNTFQVEGEANLFKIHFKQEAKRYAEDNPGSKIQLQVEAEFGPGVQILNPGYVFVTARVHALGVAPNVRNWSVVAFH